MEHISLLSEKSGDRKHYNFDINELNERLDATGTEEMRHCFLNIICSKDFDLFDINFQFDVHKIIYSTDMKTSVKNPLPKAKPFFRSHIYPFYLPVDKCFISVEKELI